MIAAESGVSSIEMPLHTNVTISVTHIEADCDLLNDIEG
jgi:hypothetical protein